MGLGGRKPGRSRTGPAGLPEKGRRKLTGVGHVPAALIVAGPTCSGKSALAMELAARFGGTVINADSMQVYADLRIITARPTPQDEAAVPHALYGVRAAREAGSVAWWRGEALAAMERAWADERVPIVCGGTGLYLAALTQGLADIPEPSAEVRAEARALLAQEGAAAMRVRLAALDPDGAARLSPTDGQRIARAWEVVRGTGRTLQQWQSKPGEVSPGRFFAVLLDPPRDDLRVAIAGRFAAMLDAGAVEEARALMALELDPALPAMRAHGVSELVAHLQGETSLQEATARAIAATGQFTKRQATWMRHHRMADPANTHTINARYSDHTQFSTTLTNEFYAFIKASG